MTIPVKPAVNKEEEKKDEVLIVALAPQKVRNFDISGLDVITV